MWKVISFTAIKDIPRILRNPNVYYRVRYGPPRVKWAAPCYRKARPRVADERNGRPNMKGIVIIIIIIIVTC
jgi:hypothetical protein